MRWKLVIFSVLCAGFAYMFPEWSKFLINEFVNRLHLKQPAPHDPYYAMFVLQWPISVCIFEVIEKRRSRGYSGTPRHCKFPQPRLSWTIHGIWNPRQYGSRCSTTQLQQADVNNIAGELNRRWVQVLRNETNFAFWKYQFIEHGTCLHSPPLLNESSRYFQQAVTWHHLYDPTNALTLCGFPPNDRTTYSNVQIKTCLENRLNINTRIILSTRMDNTYRRGTPLLREIRICFDEHFNLTDCILYDPRTFHFIYPSTVENH